MTSDFPLAPPDQAIPRDELLTRFLNHAEGKGIELYPAQEEAILALFDGHNVILNTPTGSGKSLVAAALHYLSLAEGKRSIYTCPIKALVNEKFLALCRDFGPDRVGMSTGDASVNRSAPVLCCTAEVLSNLALRAGQTAPVDDAIIDEFHYYSDRERGVAWQVPLLTLRNTRFLLMSATLGHTAPFAERMEALTGRKTVVVQSAQRPVPLEYSYSVSPLEHTVERLLQEGKAPVYVVHFTQRECAQNAQAFTSIPICTREERALLSEALESFSFPSPYGQEVKRLLRHGIGLHHAGLLPRYRVLVEQLAQRGILKLICGTDTLGVGVNVPIRTVLLTQLSKYDGEKNRVLSVRDFHQISGRAGRKGFDDRGWVVAQAPGHVIENLRLEEKAGSDPARKKKLVRRKPPDGFVGWSEETLHRLMAAAPEPLSSQFQVSHGMLLSVLSRSREDGCAAMKRLIGDSHETPASKRALRRRAFQLFRSLVEKGVVEILPRATRPPGAPRLRVNVELQEDFSLHQTLSLFLVDAAGRLPRESADYALDLLSLVEAIEEDPGVVLKKQLDRLRADKLAELKASGVEYLQRMEELEKLEHPKPNREFTYASFNAFAAGHPWVGDENIRPKSVAREMYERCLSFADYIRDYELQRSEGVVLRYLSSVYKTFAHSVPAALKTDETEEIEVFLGAMVRNVDSSLLDEWERLSHPEAMAPDRPAPEARPQTPPDILRDRRRFLAQVRAEIYALLGRLARRQFDELLADLAQAEGTEPGEGGPWTIARLEESMDEFHREHGRIRLDPEARMPAHTVIVEEGAAAWRIQQTLVDPEGFNDWLMELLLDVAQTRQTGRPALRLVRIGPLV